VQRNLIPAVLFGDKNPAAEWQQFFGESSEPVADVKAYPPWVEIREKYRQLREQNLKLLESLSEADLDKPTMAPPKGREQKFATYGQSLLVLALVAAQGDNGFVCVVMRGWSAPTYTPAQFRDLVYDAGVRAPVCFNPPAAGQMLPYYELRNKLGMEGKTPDQISESVQAAYAKGQLPRRMKSRSCTCGQRIRTWARVSAAGIRT
jgi:hypothetical protein